MQKLPFDLLYAYTMNYLIQFLQITLLTMFLLGLACFPYLSNLYTIKDKKFISRNQSSNFTMNYSINLAFLCIVTFPLAALGVQPKIVFNILLVLMFSRLLWVFIRIKGKLMFNLKKCFLLLPVSLIAIYSSLPLLIKSVREYSIFNMTTIGNNDVNSYSLIASAFLTSGKYDQGKLAMHDLNNSALWVQHETPNLVISFISNLLDLPTWKIMNLVLVLAVSMAILAAIELVTILKPNMALSRVLILSSAVIISPIVNYIFLNQFLGQAFAVGISIIIISKSLKIALKEDFDRIDFIQMVSLVAVSFYAYPVLLLPILAISMVLIIYYGFTKSRGVNSSIIKGAILSATVGTLLVLPYVENSVRLFFHLDNIESGWTLNSVTPISLFANMNYSSMSLPLISEIMLWVLLGLITIFLILASKSNIFDRKNLIFTVFIFLALSLAQLSKRNFDLSYYHNWKLLSFFIPILYLLILQHTQQKNALNIIGVLAFSISLITPFTNSVNIYPSKELVVTKDLADLSENIRLKKMESINVDLDPFFESMAAADVLSIKSIHFVSDQYYPKSINPNACTLIRNDNVKYKNSERLNSTYGIISSSNLSCKVKNLTSTVSEIQLNTEYNFGHNSNGTPFLASGWHGQETWGTWASDSESLLVFDLKENDLKGINISISGVFFEHPNLQPNRLVVKYKDKELLEYKSQQVGNPVSLDINLPKSIFSTDRQIELTLQTDFTASPFDLGLSGDQRKLGFGITKLMVSKY